MAHHLSRLPTENRVVPRTFVACNRPLIDYKHQEFTCVVGLQQSPESVGRCKIGGGCRMQGVAHKNSS